MFEKCLEQARKMAAKAKPGFMKIDGKLYTFSFCQKEWVYRVYEDGFLLVSFNVKTLSKAKEELAKWLSN